jgi:hypothetical protein
MERRKEITMAQTILRIVHRTFTDKQTISINPTVIPRKGDKIDMGFVPACEVTDVLWQYKTEATNITVVVV